MSGESRLSTELSGAVLTGTHHDEQTRDIRAIEAQALIFAETVEEQTQSVSDMEALVQDIDNRTKSGFNTVDNLTGGSANAMTASLGISTLKDNVIFAVLCLGANTVVNPTLNISGTGAKTIVKGNDLPLSLKDIPGLNFVGLFKYSTLLGKYILLNPAGFSHNGLDIIVNNITAQDLVVDDITADQVQATNFIGDGSQVTNVKWLGSNKTVSTAAPSGGADGDVWFQVAP